MDLKEESIWRNIQQKDEKTFERYYKENYKSFFLMSCKYLKDPALAEEIVNDVFLKLWEDGDKIKIESSLKSYIYKAIINRSINVLNKSKRELVHGADLNTIPQESYELRQIEENELTVKINQGFKSNDVLNYLLQKQLTIESFNEILPSLNDIFINLVEGTNAKTRAFQSTAI